MLFRSDFDNDLIDTATSPVKTKDFEMSDGEKAAKRRLGFGEQVDPILNTTGDNSGALMLIDEKFNETYGPTSESEGMGKGLDKKRHKGESGNSQSLSTSSAGSFDEHRREQ